MLAIDAFLLVLHVFDFCHKQQIRVTNNVSYHRPRSSLQSVADLEITNGKNLKQTFYLFLSMESLFGLTSDIKKIHTSWELTDKNSWPFNIY